jgi:Cu/Ag efflux protein CusF
MFEMHVELNMPKMSLHFALTDKSFNKTLAKFDRECS